MRFVRKVTERGTVTLPIEVREALGVEEGDIVELEVLRTTKASALRRTVKGNTSPLTQAPSTQPAVVVRPRLVPTEPTLE